MSIPKNRLNSLADIRTEKRKDMLALAQVASIDNRGWFIVSGGINGGVNYLYDDGEIHTGVEENTEASPFFQSKSDAELFFGRWSAI